MSKQKVATIYDYRRMKALCDALAIESALDKWVCLSVYCAVWEVPMIWDDTLNGQVPNFEKTIQALANYVIEHGRDETEALKVGLGKVRA